MLTTETITDTTIWNQTIQQYKQAHILQSWQWGQFKARTTGWNSEYMLFKEDEQVIAAASILTRRTGPLCVMYSPKGPVFATENTDHHTAVITHLQRIAARRGAIWLKVDPDLPAYIGLPADAPDADRDPEESIPAGQNFIQMMQQRHWRFSDDQVQFRNTMILDLTLSEDDILSGMNQSTRRKIRQADKKGVEIRQAITPDDLNILYDLYITTGDRQEFTIRPRDYYIDLWSNIIRDNLGFALLAEFEGQPLAGVVIFHFGRKAWYFYGMSSNKHRDKQPTYALQWTAIRQAKAAGYSLYDWWGAPDEFKEDDPMWGVYYFKRGFGGTVTRHVGAWDFVPYPPLYTLYTRLMPRILNWLRRHNTQE